MDLGIWCCARCFHHRQPVSTQRLLPRVPSTDPASLPCLLSTQTPTQGVEKQGTSPLAVVCDVESCLKSESCYCSCAPLPRRFPADLAVMFLHVFIVSFSHCPLLCAAWGFVLPTSSAAMWLGFSVTQCRFRSCLVLVVLSTNPQPSTSQRPRRSDPT